MASNHLPSSFDTVTADALGCSGYGGSRSGSPLRLPAFFSTPYAAAGVGSFPLVAAFDVTPSFARCQRIAAVKAFASRGQRRPVAPHIFNEIRTHVVLGSLRNIYFVHGELSFQRQTGNTWSQQCSRSGRDQGSA
jgi:hypothetical protein